MKTSSRSQFVAHIVILTGALVSLGGCAAEASRDASEMSSSRDQALEGKRTTLWIHGRSPGGGPRAGQYDDFSYWGSADKPAGVNKRAVNWDGESRISESNATIRKALDCFCTGDNFCYVAAHSAGDPQIGYALDLYGQSEREVQDGAPDSSGTCQGTGTTQTGWNILWVEVAGGAAGGTELADLGYWAVSDPLTSDLRTTTARSLYDHGNTQGVAFYMVAGAKGTAYSGVLPGQDDEVIAYHSSGALSEPGSFCNPGDWFCDGTLQTGDGASRKRKHEVPKWANHSVSFRDDGESYDHYQRGDWRGVVSVAASDLDDYGR